MRDVGPPARLAMAEENPDAREAKLRSVRRRLFDDDAHGQGIPSEDDVEKRFARERAEHLHEKKAKWNFDFEEERPLEGQWQWERIDKSSAKQQQSSHGDASKAQTAPENADASAEGIGGDARKQAPRELRTRCTQ